MKPPKNKSNINKIFVPFSGTIDQLLNHVDKIDPTQVENVVVNHTEDVFLDDKTAIEMIKSELNCENQQAVDILNEIKLAEISEILNNLVKEGLIEISEYDKNGEPLYSLTETGKLFSKKIINKNKYD